jgi:hypothetical protein
LHRGPKNLKIILKISNFVPLPPINTVWGPKNSNFFKTSHLFYVSFLNFYAIVFLKFVIHKMNSEMVKFEMVVLTRREKVDMTMS